MKTLVHLSDLHFGRHETALVEGVLDTLETVGPDLVAISGDFTQRGRVRQFAAARKFLDRVAAPVLAVPGNHDVPLYDVARRFLRPLKRYRRYVAPELQPTYQDDEMVVVGINTARSATFSNGRISHRQVEAMCARFSHAPQDLFRIVVAHHPLMPPPGSPKLPIVGRAAMALEAIGDAGVHLVLSGHYHQTYRGDLADHHLAIRRRSTLVVQAGTATSTRRRGEANSFNVLTVAPGRVACTVQVWDGSRFAAGEAVGFDYRGDRWIPR